MKRLLIQATDCVIGIDMDKASIVENNKSYLIVTNSSNFLSNIVIPKSDNIVLDIEDKVLKLTTYYLKDVTMSSIISYNKIRMV